MESRKVDVDVEAAAATPVIALVPKTISNAFFFPIRDGCQARAQSLGAICQFVGPADNDPTGALQAAVLDDLLDAHSNGTAILAGLAVSVVNAEAVADPIRRAVNELDLPVVTFDSDAPQSSRLAYIGTDNRAFGAQLGQGLLQLQPAGGTYALVAAEAPNLQERVAGVRKALRGTTWTELPNSLIDERLDDKRGLTQMIALMSEERGDSIDALIPCLAGPMNMGTEWEAFVEDNRNVTFVVGDAMPHQIELFERGFANGLVGQLPYQTGELCVDTLLSITNAKTNSDGTTTDDDIQQANDSQADKIYGTNLNLLLRVPLVLPPLHPALNENHIGNLSILGYVLASLVICASMFCAGWTYSKRRVRIVRASQPIFLGMMLTGVALMGSSLIFMAIEHSDVACMMVPWLLALGFVVSFAALFAKTMRINRIMRAAQRFTRIKVSVTDVLGPFLVLLLANVLVLACWTAISPLVYLRSAHVGRDPWGRVYSTYGYCGSTGDTMGGSAPFYACLAIINLGVLIVANVQAYRARNIESEYSESHWIAIVMASMLQAGLIGIPLLFLVGGSPKANFVVKTFLVFVTCFSCLVFLFVPKMLHEERRAKGHASNDGSNDAEEGRGGPDDGSDGLLLKKSSSVFLQSTIKRLSSVVRRSSAGPSIDEE